MNLEAGAATGVVGAVAVLVAAWGAWFSSVASRRGPEWSLRHLERWRHAPWLVVVLGAGTTMSVDPVWVGLGILYIAGVTGLLMRQVRRRLEAVERAYGPLDLDVEGGPTTQRAGSFLLGGGAVLGLLGMADLAVRGWTGVFALSLAGILVAAGLLVRKE